MIRTALALSPHLDDAVFSAGGTLHKLAQGGWRVVVATVFTRSVPDPGGFALACQLDKGLAADIDYMALRRAEDTAACAVLGAEPRWLPFTEAPHRGYGSAPALFGPLRDDDAIVVPVTVALESLLRELRPTWLLAPQAIGAHVDHQVVIRALDTFAGAGMPTAWWRDYPYFERGQDPRQPFADRFRALKDARVELAPAQRAAKLEAALAYRSQLGFQFGGAAALADRWREDATERFAAEGMPIDMFDAMARR